MQTAENLLWFESSQPMDEQLSALMAGFNATVQEIRMLRETVGNIRVGDDVIYRAAERYREKRAVMHGTGW